MHFKLAANASEAPGILPVPLAEAERN